MPSRGPQTFKKRQKEQQRKERQQEKMAKRLERKDERPASETASQEQDGSPAQDGDTEAPETSANLG